MGQPREACQGREEVVRAVDLVHLACARVADHRRGAIDAERHPALFADQTLGRELRGVVRRVVALSQVEVAFGEAAPVIARHRDRRHVVEHAGAYRRRELQRVPGTRHVGAVVVLGGGGEVVHRA
ncbi:hypothetical protein GCM10010483_43460 [Actinokineospora diospyrosa]